ncbi:MAG: SurA N-terminal domain-containing protein [Pseudomonadota bacterium]
MIKIIKIRQILMLASMLIFLSLNAFAVEMVDRVVAVVDGDVVTMSDLEEIIDMTPKQGRPILEQKMENFRSEALDGLIDDILLRHEIEKTKIEVNEEELTRAIASVLRQNQISPEQLRTDLAKKGISYDVYKQQITDQIKMIKFVNQVIGSQIKIEELELRDYFKKHQDMFGGGDVDFEKAKEKVHDALYEEKTQEGLQNYLFRLRQKAYIDIRL